MKRFLVVGSLLVFASISFAANNKCNPPNPKQLARSQAFLQNTPCGPVVTACNQGGYVLNCHSANGKGLMVDCIHPLKKGTPVAGVSMQPTDPAVAACKTYCNQNKGSCTEEKGVVDR